jgi:arylsulfatase A-like enzyme
LSICQDTLRDSIGLVTNNAYGLVLLHLPPPHTPGIYLPREKRFTYWPMSRITGYQNNLALADLELGEIRRAMESSGEWDKTWIIISADHSRQQTVTDQSLIDHRVPFVVKPPGRNEPVTYAPAINTVLTHDLILAILRGEVADQPALASWLDANGKPLPTVGAAPE